MSDLIAQLQAKTAELIAQAKEPLCMRIAELEAIIRSRDGDIKRTFDSLGVAIARIAELEAAIERLERCVRR